MDGMIYTVQETENIRRYRKNLLWALACLLLVVTITWFFIFGAMFEGVSSTEMEGVLLNPFMQLNFAWIAIAVFRLAWGINPRAYFWVPVMVTVLFIPFVTIPFLLIKASSIISRLQIS